MIFIRNCLSGLDWWIRIKCQNLLNWSGKKFGVTRKPVTINAFIFFIIGLAWNNRQDGIGGLVWTVACVAINFLFVAVLLSNCDKQDGEELNWDWGQFYRFSTICVFLLILPLVIWDHVLLPSDQNLYISDAAFLSQVLWLWIPTCVEAPPKERKEQRQLVRATY